VLNACSLKSVTSILKNHLHLFLDRLDLGVQRIVGVSRIIWKDDDAHRAARDLDGLGQGLVVDDDERLRQGAVGLLQPLLLFRGEEDTVVANALVRLDKCVAIPICGAIADIALVEEFVGTSEEQRRAVLGVCSRELLEDGGPPGQSADELAASGRAGIEFALGVGSERQGENGRGFRDSRASQEERGEQPCNQGRAGTEEGEVVHELR